VRFLRVRFGLSGNSLGDRNGDDSRVLKEAELCDKKHPADRSFQLLFPTRICIYIEHKHIAMSTSSVYTIRIPTDVRKIMDEMKDVNWQSDIRQMVEDLVREKKRQTLLAEARDLRKGTKNIGISASELIREDRDGSVIGQICLANAQLKKT
jgi:hypothetical protein